jgi:hypothetical protein
MCAWLCRGTIGPLTLICTQIRSHSTQIVSVRILKFTEAIFTQGPLPQ